jgi:hypothetical protein
MVGAGMEVQKTELSVATLVEQMTTGAIRLPEIQRGYVWKPTQVAKLIESLYLGYPSGSLLLWRPREKERPKTRAVDSRMPRQSSGGTPLFLLDGQQRLTSLHRVFTNHPEAQIVFNVETETFQNQSAATKQDPRWVLVYELIGPKASAFAVAMRLEKAGVVPDLNVVGERLSAVAHIGKYGYHMQVLDDLPYEKVAEIFVRVNSGGRALKTTDLALATLSANWPGVVAKLEKEAAYWRREAYPDINFTFLTRALTAAVLTGGLSVWSHGQLSSKTHEELEKGWEIVQRGLRHLIPLLKQNLDIAHSGLLPSTIVLLPAVIMLGRRPDEKLDPQVTNGLMYWFLAATVLARYSGATDTVLSQDLKATSEPHPVRSLLANIGLASTRLEVTPQALVGRTSSSPYFLLSYLAARRADATDWWANVKISITGMGAQKLEYHHIHPKSTLTPGFSNAEINDLANLAFISAKANKIISNRPPTEYFPPLPGDVVPAKPKKSQERLTDAELPGHFIPTDPELRKTELFQRFLTARRHLLATAMTGLLDSVCPDWLRDAASAAAPAVTDDLAGCELGLVVYEGADDAPRLRIKAATLDRRWEVVTSLDGFLSALDQANSGLDADVELGQENVPVQVEDDTVEIPLGPLLVVGTAQAWKVLLDGAAADARPLANCPELNTTPWGDIPRRRFPLTNAD